MVSPLFFYQLTLIALVWLCLMLQWMWPSDSAACPTIPEPLPPLPKRKREPTPFAGLTSQPFQGVAIFGNFVPLAGRRDPVKEGQGWRWRWGKCSNHLWNSGRSV